MKISKILVYQVDLPLCQALPIRGQDYSCLDCTVVEVQTDAGITGYGEVCPFGAVYAPAHPSGVREILRDLAPHLLGENPLHVGKLADRMDYLLKGHSYAKSPLDMAFWDILGKHTKLPVCDLLGGCHGDAVDLYCGITRASSLSQLTYLKEQGYKFFVWKSKGDISEDVSIVNQMQETLDHEDMFIIDCNTVYPVHEACRVAWLTRDCNYYLEQPCTSIEECKLVQQASNKPMILDESIESPRDLFALHRENFVQGVKLKISRLGGITRARQARDICVAMGMPVFLEDAWGSEMTTAVGVHLGHSTPEKYRLPSYRFSKRNKLELWEGLPEEHKAKMAASRQPGIGVSPKKDILGKPVFECSI